MQVELGGGPACLRRHARAPRGPCCSWSTANDGSERHRRLPGNSPNPQRRQRCNSLPLFTSCTATFPPFPLSQTIVSHDMSLWGLSSHLAEPAPRPQWLALRTGSGSSAPHTMASHTVGWLRSTSWTTGTKSQRRASRCVTRWPTLPRTTMHGIHSSGAFTKQLYLHGDLQAGDLTTMRVPLACRAITSENYKALGCSKVPPSTVLSLPHHCICHCPST